MSKIVERTLDFLELFADQKRPLSLSEIARLLNIPASSCHDVLQALIDRGYIYEIEPRSGYYPTQRMYEVARTIADHDPIVQRAESLLRRIRDTLEESVLLSKVTGLRATYILTLEPSHPLRYLVRAGDTIGSLHATSEGKALLASLGEPALGNVLRSAALPRLTARTITSKAVLRADLVDGNARGWFLNRDESEDGVTAVSGRLSWVSSVYIVSIAGPSLRMEAKLEKAAALLRNACKVLAAPV